jgi:hypothetical protein
MNIGKLIKNVFFGRLPFCCLADSAANLMSFATKLKLCVVCTTPTYTKIYTKFYTVSNEIGRTKGTLPPEIGVD